MEQDRGLFWVGGKPGSGKSTLMKEIYHHSQRSLKTQSTCVVGFFFNNRGTALEKSFEGFLRLVLERLIRQQPALFDCLVEDYQHKLADLYGEDENLTWTVDELRNAIFRIIATRTIVAKIYCFVDALDECDDLSIRDLIGNLHSLTSPKHETGVQICVASREIPEEFLSSPFKLPGFILEEKTSGDIATYVEDRLSAPLFTRMNGRDFKYVKAEITRKASGIFLWVNLVISLLERGCESGDTVSELKGSLGSIPGELYGVFDGLLGNIDLSYTKETNKMLALALMAKRPLTVTEFRFALAFQGNPQFTSQRFMEQSEDTVQDDTVMTKRIRRRTGALLEITTSSGEEQAQLHYGRAGHSKVVQFIHQSVKDYLLGDVKTVSSRIIDGHSLVVEGHNALSRACIRYLMTEEVQALPLRLKGIRPSSAVMEKSLAQELPFLQYAIGFWRDHYLAGEESGSPQIEEIEALEQGEDKAFHIWREIWNWFHPSDPVEFHETLLALAIKERFLTYARKKFKDGADPNRPLEEGRNYLYLATVSENVEMVKLLLEFGANVNACGYYVENALHAAAVSGNEPILKLLLDNGADVSQPGRKFNDAVCAGAYSGQWNIVKLLLKEDFSKISNMWTLKSILNAGQKGFDDRKSGHIRDIRDLKMADSLPHGIGSGLFGVMSMLSQSDVTAEMIPADNIDAESLWWLGAGSEAVIRLLIQSNADPNAWSSIRAQWLFMICAFGTIDAVENLLSYDAGLCTGDEVREGLLHVAIFNKSETILEFLLDQGLDPNIKDDKGSTPLHGAAFAGTQRHFRALVARGADLNALDRNGLTVFHHAMLNTRSNEQMFDRGALADVGVTVNTRDMSGNAPIHFAAQYGSFSTFRNALELGADPTVVNNEGRTVQHFAASNRTRDSHAILSSLLGTKNLANARDDGGSTPLHCVLHAPDVKPAVEVMEITMIGLYRSPNVDKETAVLNLNLLLDQGAEINCQDDCGNTVLHLACWKGLADIVRLLLQRGADPSLEDHRACKAIDLAREDEIRELLEATELGRDSPNELHTHNGYTGP
jgi:ankyrin repeat protein